MTRTFDPARAGLYEAMRMSRRGLMGTSLATVIEVSAASGAPSSTTSGTMKGGSDLLGPGISHELAIRRAASLTDVRYDLDLDLTQRDIASGSVRIAFKRAGSADDLVLDFRGPNLTDLRINGQPIAAPDWRSGHVRIPKARLLGGENRIEADFTTPIAASGAAIIRFDDHSDGATYLYTLLVPSDANLLFPCLDQPDLKARFRWTIRAPFAWSVLANARVQSQRADGASTVWSFGQTEPIPTYLAAFAAGPWATWPSAPPGERPITLYARASRRAEVDAEAIIKSNRDAARWLADWFGVPFPFGKLDALLAPAFPFGGMEHVGEIFYNENSFIFREPPTYSQRLGRDSTIYHEVSHQWFGDFVTMRWFDDLWLKEGFATYMAQQTHRLRRRFHQRHQFGVAAAGQPRRSQEQLRPHRLQQGALDH
jgi:aminopeptidase N